MQRKDLALRVLSTAAIMSIVTSIAAPAFAGTYYIGKGSIDVVTSTDGNVHVIQNRIAYIDRDNEIVIKDGTSEADTTLKDANRAAATPAADPAATHATQELEAAGSADAAGESQPDPDAAFTLSEAEEDSAQTQEGKDTTEEKKDPAEDSPKEDVVYQYDPADPEPEQQATKPASTAPAEPEATAPETTLAAAPTASPAADPATTTPAEGSAKKPTKNVIRVINNWAEKVLNIRLSNVNIESDTNSKYADGTTDVLFDAYHRVSAAEVQGTGNTKIELDGQNVLDSSKCVFWAGLSKKGSGNLTITDETSDKGETITAKEETDTSGSLRAEGGCYRGPSLSGGAAAIGGSWGQATDNITIEGYATVKANTKDNNGAGIGGGAGAKGSNITIQGHATIQTASSQNDAAIGSESGNVEVTIKDNVSIDNEDTVTHPTHPLWVSSGIGGGYIARNSGRTVKVTIDGGENGQIEIGKKSAITGPEGAISGTEVTIKDHVLLKMKKRDPHVERYILVNDAEAEVGTRSNPTAGGLVNTIGDNTELWYTDYHNKLQKIVHGKNLCTKHETNHKDATCTTPGSKTYQCTYEKENGAVNPEHKDQWVENTDIDPNAHNYVKTTVPPTCGAQGYDEYTCKNNPDHTYKDNFVAPTGNHQFNAWHQTKAPTCMEEGEEQHECEVCGKPETRKVDKLDHVEELRGAKEPTCTEPGYTGDKWCTRGDHLLEKGSVIPVTGHHWKDNGDGTHTCTKCGATEGQPFNTNSALELRVVDAEGMNQPFTVSQNGTLRTYTGAYDTATLTGDLDTLRYLQDHGAQTIQFVTNGQTSSFDINDLLAQGSGSEVFYLTHRGAEEPTLLLVEADHSDLVKD